MSALLEYECRVPVGGYEVITIEEPSPRARAISQHAQATALHERAKHERPNKLGGSRQLMALAALAVSLAKDDEPLKLRILQPRSERIRRFDLFKIGSSAFLEFAQTPPTEDGIKAFADRYGLLHPDSPYPPGEFASDHFRGSRIDNWSRYIGDMHQTVELWNRRDFSKVIPVERLSEALHSSR